MVVGESGLGKSTLVNSLFLSDLYTNRKMPPAEERVARTTEIEKTTMEIEEKGVKLRLTVVDTPGFGDGLEGNGSWKACLKYVDDQFAAYFDGESGLNRKNIVDTRVHCCLYLSLPMDTDSGKSTWSSSRGYSTRSTSCQSLQKQTL